MKLFDLHCDTLYRAYTENSTLFNDSFHISFHKAKNIQPYIQCLAVWIPDEYRGENAVGLFDGCVATLKSQLSNTEIRWCQSVDDIEHVKNNGQTGVILTVESGAALGGDIRNIRRFADIGVKMMTLTWNGTNELGDGVGVTDNNHGLSEFGRECVRELEKNHIIVDISHASEKLFYDVAAIAERPFVASHSNSKAVCDHPRNLTNEQFKIIKQKGGIVGINFCRDFLNKNLTNAKMYDIIRTAEHFLSLGGEKIIAFGGDFDGADIPSDIMGLESMSELYELFLKHYSETLVNDIFFNNAYHFFKTNF